MRMNRSIAFLWASMLLIFLSANNHGKPKLTFDGLGDIRIGMSSEQVKKLGFRLTSGGPWNEVGDEYFVSCHYLDSSPSFPGISLMMSDDKVVRIDIGYDRDKGWQSYSGAKVGMSQINVQSIYGDWLKISGHPYLDKAGSYLRLNSSDGKYAMIFETAIKDLSGNVSNERQQEKFVTHFRSGLAGPVSYIEGCA